MKKYQFRCNTCMERFTGHVDFQVELECIGHSVQCAEDYYIENGEANPAWMKPRRLWPFRNTIENEWSCGLSGYIYSREFVIGSSLFDPTVLRYIFYNYVHFKTTNNKRYVPLYERLETL